jgi:hypothetical protein
MPDYEARIRTKFGELTIHFADKADLENKLAQVPDLCATIEKGLGDLLIKEPEKAVAEFADLYTVGSDDSIKLLKFPKKKADALRLAAFLSPKDLTPIQLKQITGVSEPTDYMGRDFARNSDGTYSLISEGKAKVTNTIIPSLRGEKKTK